MHVDMIEKIGTSWTLVIPVLKVHTVGQSSLWSVDYVVRLTFHPVLGSPSPAYYDGVKFKYGIWQRQDSDYSHYPTKVESTKWNIPTIFSFRADSGGCGPNQTYATYLHTM